jgi:hypothetical protein
MFDAKSLFGNNNNSVKLNLPLNNPNMSQIVSRFLKSDLYKESLMAEMSGKPLKFDPATGADADPDLDIGTAAHPVDPKSSLGRKWKREPEVGTNPPSEPSRRRSLLPSWNNLRSGSGSSKDRSKSKDRDQGSILRNSVSAVNIFFLMSILKSWLSNFNTKVTDENLFGYYCQ